MSFEDESRREALKIMGAIGSTCAFPFSSNELYGQQAPPVTPPKQVHQHAGPPERPTAIPNKAKPGFFSSAEFEVLSRLSDLIIPTTDTPGAVEAGVPIYIDSVVGANAELQQVCRAGLGALEQQCQREYSKGFVALSEDQQIRLLTPIFEAVDKGRREGVLERFFLLAKNLTADGYYTSYTGLVQELQYKGNTVLDRFPASTLPEC